MYKCMNICINVCLYEYVYVCMNVCLEKLTYNTCMYEAQLAFKRLNAFDGRI